MFKETVIVSTVFEEQEDPDENPLSNWNFGVIYARMKTPKGRSQPEPNEFNGKFDINTFFHYHKWVTYEGETTSEPCGPARWFIMNFPNPLDSDTWKVRPA